MSKIPYSPRFTCSRRQVLATGGAAAVLGGLAPTAWAHAAPASAAEVVSLGTPVVDVANASGAVAPGWHGEPLIYTVTSGSGGMNARFNVVDANTGQTLHTKDLRGSSSFGVLATPRRTVYVGDTAGHLYRWTPRTSQWEDLGKPLPDERIIYRLIPDDRGNIYGGTYPGGKVFRFDPATDEVRDYGSVVPGQSYVRSVSYHDGVVYAGTQPQAHLIALDVETGDAHEIAFPDGTDLNQLVHDSHRFGNHLYPRLTKAGGFGTLHVYDLATREWTDRIEDVNGRDISAPDADGRVHFLRGGRVVAYDPVTRELTDTPATLESSGRQLRGMGWVDLADPAYPGPSLVAMITRGEALRLNPRTGSFATFDTTIPGTPVSIRALATDSQVRVHVGATNLGGHGIVDPDTGDSTQYTFGEYQGMARHEDRLYLGIYGSARIYEYDTTIPWNTELDPAPEASVPNPVEIFTGADADQDRPFGMLVAGNTLAVGTVSRTGVTGGALTLYDLDQRTKSVHRDEFVNDSVIAVAASGSTLFCGTSIHGGYGTPTTSTDGKIVAVDLDTGAVQWESVPVPGDTAVSALTTDSAGRLWGITAGAVFTTDPSTSPIAFETRQFADYTWPEPAWVQADIIFNPADGHVYATIANHGLVKINPDTFDSSLVSDNPSLYRMAVDSNGQLFVTAGAELFKIQT